MIRTLGISEWDIRNTPEDSAPMGQWLAFLGGAWSSRFRFLSSPKGPVISHALRMFLFKRQ